MWVGGVEIPHVYAFSSRRHRRRLIDGGLRGRGAGRPECWRRRGPSACPRCANTGSGRRHSITSLARASIAGEMVIPIAFAALSLMTNSNLSGWITGKSAGFAPFSSLAIWSAESR
jgi:hypothetical protein